MSLDYKPIDRAEVLPDGVLRLIDVDGTYWHYYRHPESHVLVLGFPYIVCDPDSGMTVHLFVPIGQERPLPFLLRVETARQSYERNVRS